MEWRVLRSFDGTRLAWRVDRPPSATDALPVVLCNGIAALQHGAPRLSGALWRTLWRSRVVYWGARLLRGTNAQAPRPVMAQYFAHVRSLDPGLLLEMSRSMQAHDAEAVLDRIDVPLLVLAGSADGLTALARMTGVAVRGRGELVVFDGATHTLPAERPADVAAHLLRFCAEVDGWTRASAGGRGTVGA